MSAVVVTGAASGMGRASVEHLRGLSDTIFAVDIHAPQIDGTIGVACDITDPAAIASLCAMVSEAGGLRALVHAAGISPTMDNARRVWEVNLLGTQLLLDGIDPLVGQGTAVVCFSSVAAHHVAPYVTPEQAALLNDPLGDDFLDRAVAAASDSGYAYGLSKVGVQWAVRRAASAWGRRGGRAVSISPGLIDTPMGQLEYANQPAMRRMLDQTPLARMGSADEVASVAAFLVSDGASFITGVDVLVDGGVIQAPVTTPS